jgi:uncharacterized protein (DUF169 family)
MTEYQKYSRQIQESLGLTLAPVGVSFCDEVPEGIPEYEGHVAAGCQFWEQASHSLFATSAVDHHLCSIGVYTHNLVDAPETQQHELETTLKTMIGIDYIREPEVKEIPVVNRQSKYVVYGPLSEFQANPDVVILFAHAQQGLILSEAAERVDDNTPPAMGRPACAVIPQVMNQGKAAMSLGCCGARAYLEALSDNIALWALPGENLANYAEQIETLAKANNVLTRFHQQRRQDVDAGGEPTVEESLQRM